MQWAHPPSTGRHPHPKFPMSKGRAFWAFPSISQVLASSTLRSPIHATRWKGAHLTQNQGPRHSSCPQPAM